MGKYDRLGEYLGNLTSRRIALDFAEVDAIVGGLPRSASDHRPWWANTRWNPQSRSWLDAGWEVDSVSLPGRTVTFIRAESGSLQADGHQTRPGDRNRVTRPSVDQRVEAVVDDFGGLLDYYDRELPFDRSGQYAHHRRTIDLRRALGGVAEAVADADFMASLYSTLRAWGIGVRASRLVPLDDFAAELRRWSVPLQQLDHHRIDDPNSDADAVGRELWRLIGGMEIVRNRSRIVPLSKTIHHLLPELLPPIDRMYTQKFFGINAPAFQNDQESTFLSIWGHFVDIARKVDPQRHVGSGWRTSRSKLMDNAIVAFVHRDSE